MQVTNVHAISRLARWPSDLGQPFDPAENTIRARAQSLLTGGDLGVCPPLTYDQARDVLAWHQPKESK